MCTRTIPVTVNGLGVEAHVNFKVFGDTLEQPSSDPDLVGHFDGAEDANLELPLTHHHFGVSALDAESGA